MVSVARNLVVTIGLLALLSGAPARADVRQVRLGVKGATCATCAFALRKAFKRMSDVEDAKLTTKLATMEIRMKPGMWPNLLRMREMIRDTGFEAVINQSQLVVSGTLLELDQGMVLYLDGMKDPINLPVSAAVVLGVKGVDLGAYLGKRVELDGVWSPVTGPFDKIGSLSVKDVRAAKKADTEQAGSTK